MRHSVLTPFFRPDPILPSGSRLERFTIALVTPAEPPEPPLGKEGTGRTPKSPPYEGSDVQGLSGADAGDHSSCPVWTELADIDSGW